VNLLQLFYPAGKVAAWQGLQDDFDQQPQPQPRWVGIKVAVDDVLLALVNKAKHSSGSHLHV